MGQSLWAHRVDMTGSQLWRPWWGIHTACFLLTLVCPGPLSGCWETFTVTLPSPCVLCICLLLCLDFLLLHRYCSDQLRASHMSFLYLHHLIDCFQRESHSEVLQVRASRWTWRTNVDSRTLCVLFLQNSKLLFVLTTASYGTMPVTSMNLASQVFDISHHFSPWSWSEMTGSLTTDGSHCPE